MNRNRPYLTHPKYRPDIDGLRAVAVLVVVIFHFFPDKMPGGYIGVDIFFVISGFLISTIIFSSLERNRFSLIEFYIRRVRRIFPALILVMVSGLALGWFVLFADEYKQLGKHTAASAGFLQNFMLWHEKGYFDNSAETKPLLHLWSLAVEEQFYIFWPLLIAFVWKRRWSFLGLTVVIAVISFATNIYLITRGNISAAFYLPIPRFWELMVGGVLADIILHRPHLIDRHKDIQSILGFALLFAGLIFINSEREFPGWWALLPTVGAFFVISAGPTTWLNEKLLSNRLMVGIGLISYPLYLWHWLLLCYMRVIESGILLKETKLTILALALVLSVITYKIIERPLRQSENSVIKALTLTILMILLGYFGLSIYNHDGINEREVVKVNMLLKSGYDGGDGGYSVNECGIEEADVKKLFANCVSDKRGVAKYALLGDSKAAPLFPGLVRTSTDSGRWLFIGGNGPNGAPVPLLSTDPIYSSFQNLTVNAVRAIASNREIETVVIVAAVRAIFSLSDGAVGGNMSTYNNKYMSSLGQSLNYRRVFDGLDSTINSFVSAGKKVVIVVDNPALPSPEDCISRQISIPLINVVAKVRTEECYLPLAEHIDLARVYRNLLIELQNKHPNDVQVFDTTNLMCDEELGVCGPTHNGRLLYSYTDHISDYSAGRIGASLNTFLNNQ